MPEERKSPTAINPNVLQAILLDDIDKKLKENSKTQNTNIELLKSLIGLQTNNKSTTEIINTKFETFNTNLNTINTSINSFNSKFDKLINTIEKNLNIQSKILDELKDEADEGEILRSSGTVTTTAFTIINTITDPGHPVKAFELTNDGDNSIYVGFNVVISSEGADIIDVTNNLSRFDLIANGEDILYKFNRNKIRNIYLLASGGNSDYRLKLTW